MVSMRLRTWPCRRGFASAHIQQRDVVGRPAGPFCAALLCLCLARCVCHGPPQIAPTLLPVLCFLLADSDAWALTVVLCLFEVFFEISICTLSWVSCAKRDGLR